MPFIAKTWPIRSSLRRGAPRVEAGELRSALTMPESWRRPQVEPQSHAIARSPWSGRFRVPRHRRQSFSRRFRGADIAAGRSLDAWLECSYIASLASSRRQMPFCIAPSKICFLRRTRAKKRKRFLRRDDAAAHADFATGIISSSTILHIFENRCFR